MLKDQTSQKIKSEFIVLFPFCNRLTGIPTITFQKKKNQQDLLLVLMYLDFAIGWVKL